MRAFIFGCTLLFSTNLEGAQRPNILLLMAEDLSSRVGAFEDDVAQTPHLNALARQGVRYDQVFTTSGVCAPSRAAHILGMHQIATGTQHMRASSAPTGAYVSVPPPQVKAYPELLRAAGYYTYTDNKLDYQISGAWGQFRTLQHLEPGRRGCDRVAAARTGTTLLWLYQFYSDP